MNYYIKLYIVKKDKETGILLYGYGLLDTASTRGWSCGQMDEKLKLYKYTCVMDEAAYAFFTEAITKGENVELTQGFFVKMNLVSRPPITYIPNREAGKGIVKSLSQVDEFWNLQKKEIMIELKEVYGNGNLRVQRQKIHALLKRLSEDTTLPFLGDSAKSLGNIEMYRVSLWNEYFAYESVKKENDEDMKTSAFGAVLKKKKTVTFDVLVHCELKNAERYVLNEIREMKKEEQELYFEAKEVISHIYIEIWNKETGELIYASGAPLMRQAIFSIGMMRGKNLQIHDPWVTQLEKTFSVNKKKIEKIKNVSYEYGKETMKIGGFERDPWNPAGDAAVAALKPYRLKKLKGAFCRKTNTGDGEIDSFMTIAGYLNEAGVKNVIIVDPYFSILSMHKFLGRIKNQNLRLEIITSLKDIDPDKDSATENCTDKNYLDKVRIFLHRNNHVIHPYLKISNITHSGNVAIHDRYLLRYFEDGSVDGYLLSNSLNRAGKNYSFVVAPMDEEVVYEVLEYVSNIQDMDLQKKLPKVERLECEILWDTLERNIKEEEKEVIPKKQWEMELEATYQENKKLEISGWFHGPFVLKEDKKQYIQKLCWAIYYGRAMNVEESILLFKDAGITKEELLALCMEIAVELEKEEELCEMQNPLSRRDGVHVFRKALNPESQKEIKIYPKYLMRDGLYGCYYQRNAYVSVVYQIMEELDACELVSAMLKAHSPKALEHLWMKLAFDEEFHVDLYKKMLASELEWLQRLAYSYYTSRLLAMIENGEKEGQIIGFLKSEGLDSCQYADCLNEISFEMDQLERGSKKSLDLYEILKDMREKTLCILEDTIKKGQTTDAARFTDILRGPNDKWYSRNLTDIVLKCEEGHSFTNYLWSEILSLLQEKWTKSDVQFFESDYEVTGNAAYASFVCFGSDIHVVCQQLKIDSRALYQALEPGIKDRNYTAWNKSVQKVLWQLLFLKDFQLVLERNHVERKEIDKTEEMITQLSAVKSQCEDWYDLTGLCECVFS